VLAGRFLLEGAPVTVAAELQVSLDGRVLWNGVRQASACSDDALLGIAQGQTLTLVVFRETRLVVSWRFPLSTTISGPVVFGIPPMIVGHLSGSVPPTTGLVRLAVSGGNVSLTSIDAVGPFELRWRFDLNKFPVPPEFGRLLMPPARFISAGYLDIADAIHGAVAKLVSMETRRQIHRTKLAILLGLFGDRLVVDGQEVRRDTPGFYYFDPRLIIRALEFMHSTKIQLGVTELGPRRAFLSLMDRQPDHTVHCALLSIGLETQRLIGPPLVSTIRHS
jgi:hypothetical protein